jgi:hypothetical protein
MQLPSILPTRDVLAGKKCAFCNEPFRIAESGIEAYQVEDSFFCNEFCAQAISEKAQMRTP